LKYLITFTLSHQRLDDFPEVMIKKCQGKYFEMKKLHRSHVPSLETEIFANLRPSSSFNTTVTFLHHDSQENQSGVLTQSTLERVIILNLLVELPLHAMVIHSSANVPKLTASAKNAKFATHSFLRQCGN
jgi:hypothetical protein